MSSVPLLLPSVDKSDSGRVDPGRFQGRGFTQRPPSLSVVGSEVSGYVPVTSSTGYLTIGFLSGGEGRGSRTHGHVILSPFSFEDPLCDIGLKESGPVHPPFDLFLLSSM